MILVLDKNAYSFPDFKVAIMFIINISIGVFSASVIFWGFKKITLQNDTLKIQYPFLGINKKFDLRQIKLYKYDVSSTPFKSYKSYTIVSENGNKVKFIEFDYSNFDELTSAITASIVPNKKNII